MKPISVSDRVGALEESAVHFKDHLIDVRGVTLSAELRLVVAQCARDAIHCKACVDTLPREACLRPGTKVYDAVAAIQHDNDSSSKELLEGGGGSIPNDKKNAKAISAIVTIVHSLVNHQVRLDKDWYDDCVQALSKADILPESVTGAKKQYLLCISAFAEILSIMTMSYCVNISFLIMGRDVPRLPSKEEINNGRAAKTGPLLLDWTSVLKKDPSRDPSSAFAYYFVAKDVDEKSGEYLRISDRGRKAMAKWGDVLHPGLCAVFAAEDVWMLSEIEAAYYIPAKDMMSLFNTKLDPTVRCADDFSRFDTEFVAHAVAVANQCDY